MTVKATVKKVLHPRRHLRDKANQRAHDDDDDDDESSDGDDGSGSSGEEERRASLESRTTPLNSRSASPYDPAATVAAPLPASHTQLPSSKSESSLLSPLEAIERPRSSAANSVTDMFFDAPDPDEAAQAQETNGVNGYDGSEKGQPGGSSPKKPSASKLTNGHGSSPNDLKPTDRHYLNKALVHLQMAEEWSALSNVGELSKYGHPYLPHANGPRSKPGADAKDAVQVNEAQLTEAPLLSYLFSRFGYRFPGFQNAPKGYWHRIQAFFDSMAESNLSSTPERAEVTKRRVMAFAFNRLFATFAAVALPATGESHPAGMDAELRGNIDDLVGRDGERERRIWADAGKKVKLHRENWRGWIRRLYLEDELDRTFQLIADVPSVKELPESYQYLADWAALWISQLIYAVFVSADNAKEHLGLFSRIHSMIPYGLCRYALKIASPAFLAKTMVNLIFSAPWGSRSVFTRVTTAVMNGELKNMQKKINDLSTTFGHKEVVQALQTYVHADRSTQDDVRASSLQHREDVLLSILRHSDLDEHHIKAWRERYQAYFEAVSGDHPEVFKRKGPAQEFADAKALLRAISGKRDAEQVLKVLLEPNTAEIVKESVSLLYETIGSIAAVTKLAMHINNLEAFMSDVVKTAGSEGCNRADTINLVRRHVQSFWAFLHEVHSRDKDIMAGFIEWDRNAFSFLKDGVPRTRDERAGTDDDLLDTLPAEERVQAIAEARNLASWTRMHKAMEDIRLRLDFAQLEDSTFVVDTHALFRQLVQEDKEFTQVVREQAGRGVTEPDQAIEWLWYASRSHASSTIAPTETATSGKARPPVKLDHVRLLLPEYAKRISTPLSADKENM